VSDAAAHDEPVEALVVVPVDEAVRLAKPWTADATTGIEEVSDEEWDAFVAALERR
jgi:hypothetical protein